jgi:2,3,4,5-tetrahydropyridine-2-carboxylate N-succinyltransferase
MTQALQALIDQAWEDRTSLSPKSAPNDIREAVANVISQLDRRTARGREARQGLGRQPVDQEGRAAVVPPGRQRADERRRLCPVLRQGADQVRQLDGDDFAKAGFRVVPPAVARRGSFIARNAVLMPSYVNIGAYVDEGTMVDTWATVGSCAQIGKNVHLSGGVGIGGVLEPLQANPVIIEDNCFIGARSEVVEGVIVEENSVISMGVYLGQSTKIYDRETGEIHYGRVPAGSVVVAGNLPSKDGKYSLYCAVIVKKVDAQTRAKTSLNDLLRD